MRSALGLLLLLALSGHVRAQTEDPLRPTTEEREWLQRCLAAVDPEDVSAGQRCAGLLTKACLGHDEGDVPRLRQPPGRSGHPRGCAPIEGALWEEHLARWIGEALRTLPKAALEPFVKSQQAWLRYRDRKCAIEIDINPGFYGRDLAAECRREAVTSRALELRRLAAMGREAKP